MQTKILCVLMRGGTSKRPLFKASDLKDREIPSRPRPETRAVPPLVAKHGGEYLARGGKFEVLTRDWKPNRIVLFK